MDIVSIIKPIKEHRITEGIVSFEVNNLSDVSDGYHTLSELYDHRITLYIAMTPTTYPTPFFKTNNMTKVFILKKDLPWAKAGTEWEFIRQSDSGRVMLQNGSNVSCVFPSTTFDDWFEEKKAKRWRAEEGERYWLADNGGEVLISCDTGSKLSNNRFDFGNYFRTKDQAEEASKRICALLEAYHEEIGQ